jgi:hypothetical protein
MPIQTRHIGLTVVGALTSLVTILGFVSHNAPTVTDYLVTTAIPTIITIADWVVARIKDAKGINSISAADIITLIQELKLLKDKAPVIVPPVIATTTTSAPPSA